jgi:hypothetical protein
MLASYRGLANRSDRIHRAKHTLTLLATQQSKPEAYMSDTNEMEMISRRGVFRILGLATLGLAVMPTVLTVSDAEAQGTAPATPSGQAPQSPQTPQTGTERRQERRTERTERRQERRTERTKRREERRTAREERRKTRQQARAERREKPSGTTATPKATTPQ